VEAICRSEGQDGVIIVEGKSCDLLRGTVHFAKLFKSISRKHIDMFVSGGDQKLTTLGELKFSGLFYVKGMEKA
jgi:hypothetical protein